MGSRKLPAFAYLTEYSTLVLYFRGASTTDISQLGANTYSATISTSLPCRISPLFPVGRPVEILFTVISLEAALVGQLQPGSYGL